MALILQFREIEAALKKEAERIVARAEALCMFLAAGPFPPDQCTAAGLYIVAKLALDGSFYREGDTPEQQAMFMANLDEIARDVIAGARQEEGE